MRGADAARRHAADLRLRRGAVLRVPAVAVVRSRRLVRQRVPALLRRTARTRDPAFRATFLEPATETGRRRNFGTIGSRILWAPFYAVADAGVRVARALGSTVEADGYSPPYVAAVCLRLGGATACWRCCSRWCAARRVLEAAGLLAPAAAAVAGRRGRRARHAAALLHVRRAGLSHASSAFAVALFIFAWLGVRDRWTPGGLVVLGALAGADGHGPRAGRVLRRRAGASTSRGAVVAASAGGARVGPRRCGRGGWRACVYLPQAAAYLALNGRLGPSHLVEPQDDVDARRTRSSVLFSPEHGFFFWTPLALLAIAG